jgi:ferredoxin-NADP reductase
MHVEYHGHAHSASGAAFAATHKQAGDVEKLVVFGGLAVFPLSLFFTYLMLTSAKCLVDQCTFDVDPVGNQQMQVAIGVFHAWLWGVGGVLYAVKLSPNAKRFLSAPVCGSSVSCVTPARGQVLLGLAIAGLLVFNSTFWYYTFQDFWVSSDVYIPIQNFTTMRAGYEVTQQTGRLNEIFLGLAMLPVARNSVLDKVFDLSYVNAVAFHRIVGWFLVLSVALHGSAFAYAATQDPEQSYQSLMFNMYDERMAASMAAGNMSYLDWGIGMYMNELGALAGMFMVLPALASLPWVRRRAYNVFYALHMLLHVSMVFAWLHASSNFYYSMPGIGLYVIDLAARLAHRFGTVKVLAARQLAPGMVRVDFDVSGRPELQTFKPGQFVRVCVPAVTGWEWHPFSLVGAQGSAVASICMTTTRSNSPAGRQPDWTAKCARALLLGAAAAGPPGGKPVEMCVEGPFGGGVDFDCSSAGTAVFFVAGSGVTPALGMLHREGSASPDAGPDKTPKRVLVWSVRVGGGGDCASVFAELDPQVTVRIHATGGNVPMRTLTVAPASSSNDVEMAGDELQLTDQDLAVLPGRVDFLGVLREHLSHTSDEDQRVFVCGPSGFTCAALAAVAAFRAETRQHVSVSRGSFEL